MRPFPSRVFLSGVALGALVLAAPTPAVAQGELHGPKPGRDPSQPIDSAYTAKIHEYTTEPFFSSPLVNYLPASRTVPTPMATLGDIAGARDNLPYAEQVYAYMRSLAKASPRVRVWTIGHTEEGREMIAVGVASEAVWKNLDRNKANLAKLADPRTIGMNDAVAEQLIPQTVPVYYITGTIHSPESGAPTALMELAYRLAVDNSAYIRNIRDHLITLITPVVEVDGRDREVDTFKWHMAHPKDTPLPLIYWGHYVAHDNNRDAMGAALDLTQNVMNTYVSWNAQVLHDLHESVPFMYDNTIGDGPYNAWIDPLLANEWQMIGWNNVQEMTRFGMPGVFAHGDFDTWSPGYLMFIAAMHNGISRLYETFGNGGTAETLERTLSPSETQKTWYRQDPPLPHVKWSLRDNNNYEETGLLVSLQYFANNRQLFLENFYTKAKRSIAKATTEGPAAYVLPGDDPRLGAQADLLHVMQRQHVEISRATAPFTVQVRVKASSNGRGGRGGRGGANGGEANAPAPGSAADTAVQPKPPRTEARTFPAGSYIIRMDQPYSRIADALLDYQYWSPNDPQKHPYDDTGWTFPEGFGVECVRVVDTTVLKAPMARVTGDIEAPGGVHGSGTRYAINNNGDNSLITLRYQLRSADFQAAEDSFTAGGRHFDRGSFLVSGVASGDLDRAAKALGIEVYAVSDAPGVATHPVRAPRVAILHTWQGTQTEGWWRLGFDAEHVPYDYVSTQMLARTPDLNAKYDVIVFPPAGGSATSIIEGMPMWRNPLPYKKTALTPNIGVIDSTDDIRPGMGWDGLAHLRAFVDNGGLLITAANTADFAMEFGMTNGVSSSRPRSQEVVGSYLRTRIVDGASPIAYGIKDSLAVYSDAGESYGVSNTGGGRGGFGGRGRGGAQRETGRGTADDQETVQGRPPLTPEFEAPIRPHVQPWQAQPITDEQLRNALNIIPPAERPRVIMRFADQKDLLVSGLLDGGSDIAQRPMVIDAPHGKGHVVLFANNPVYRAETIGSYALVFNAIMNWDNLNAGRVLDAR